MKNNPFLKRTILHFVNSLITAFLGIVAIKIFGLYVSPEKYGIYSVVYSIYAVVVSIASMIFSQSILRYYSEYEEKNELDLFYKIYVEMFIVFSLAFIVLSLLTIPMVALFVKNRLYSSLIIAFIVSFLFECFFNTTISIVRCKGKAGEEIKSTILNQGSKLVLFLILFFFIIKGDVVSIVLATMGGFLIASISLIKYWRIPKNIFRPISKNEIKKILVFSLPLIGVPIVNYLLSMSDQLIIKVICGDYDTGLYSMGHKIASNLFSLITFFLIAAGHPVIMKKYDSESKESASKFISKLSFLYFVICLPFVIETIVFSEYLLRIFASEQYIDSAFVLSISSIGLIFCGYINYTNKPWEMTKKSGRIAFYSLFGAILNIILNLIFVPIYGFNAAAVTTIASYFFVIFLSREGSRKIANISIGTKKMAKLLVINGVLLVYLYFISKLFVSDFMTFILVAASGMIVYASMCWLCVKKEIIDVVNEFKKVK